MSSNGCWRARKFPSSFYLKVSVYASNWYCFFSPVCTYGASTSFSHFSDYFESCAEHIVRLAETSEIWRGKTSFLSLTGFNDSQLKILDNLNYRAARLVSGAQKYTSYDELLKDLAWKDTRARKKYLCLCQLYKIMSHMTTSLDHDHHCLTIGIQPIGHLNITLLWATSLLTHSFPTP